MDVIVLTAPPREVEEYHGGYEATAPERHWSDSYAACIVARDGGRAPDEAAGDAARHLEAVSG